MTARYSVTLVTIGSNAAPDLEVLSESDDINVVHAAWIANSHRFPVSIDWDNPNVFAALFSSTHRIAHNLYVIFHDTVINRC